MGWATFWAIFFQPTHPVTLHDCCCRRRHREYRQVSVGQWDYINTWSYRSPSFILLSKRLWVPNRVARWHIFKPKIPICVNFGGWNGRCFVYLVYFVSIWYILCPFGIFCVHLVYFEVICYIFPVLVCCTNKNLATLVPNDAVLLTRIFSKKMSATIK
jgi:hypothetical protein